MRVAEAEYISKLENTEQQLQVQVVCYPLVNILNSDQNGDFLTILGILRFLVQDVHKLCLLLLMINGVHKSKFHKSHSKNM